MAFFLFPKELYTHARAPSTSNVCAILLRYCGQHHPLVWDRALRDAVLSSIPSSMAPHRSSIRRPALDPPSSRPSSIPPSNPSGVPIDNPHRTVRCPQRRGTPRIYTGHDYIGLIHIGHSYAGHSYAGHNYVGHNYCAMSTKARHAQNLYRP